MKLLFSNRFKAFAFATAFLLVLSSCKKDEVTPTQDEAVTDTAIIQNANETARADESFTNLDDVTQVASEEDDEASPATPGGAYNPSFGRLRDIIGNCATITVTPHDGTFPKTISIDFGNGCIGLDGKRRAGKIMIFMTDRRSHPNSVITTTLVNYSVDFIQLQGTKVCTNNSNADGIRFSVDIEGGKVIFPNNHGYDFEMHKNKRQIAGQATASPMDNVFEITGTSNVHFFNGNNIHVSTQVPVIKAVNCHWRSDGILKIVVSNTNHNFNFLFNYGYPATSGAGACDNLALLSWNNGNGSTIITLP